jgi:hypothetical protein
VDPEDQVVGLDWYIPPDRDHVPIVPLPIIDFVAGSISLIRSNMLLPAAALLLIALESSLWEDLAFHGIRRDSERVTYASVAWDFKVVQDKLVLSIAGADKQLRDLRADCGPQHTTGSLRSRRLRNEGDSTVLRVDLPNQLADYLATEAADNREVLQEKGLAEAIRRARSAGTLPTLPNELDETLFRLRNALIHLPSGDQLEPPIPIPYGQPINSLSNLRSAPQFIRQLAFLVVNLINSIYAAH